ncbi:hypothetical protein V1523DRAFT_441608 [Lipomyces doorenjongii]
MADNLTLYTIGMPNGCKTSITLEGLDLAYRTEEIPTKIQKEPWFSKFNAIGRISAIKDGNLNVFESGAIVLYLTFYPHGSTDYYEMISYQALRFLAMVQSSNYGIDRYVAKNKRLYSALKSRLRRKTGLLAACQHWRHCQHVLGARKIDLNEWPAVKKWVDRISAREALQRGVNVSPPTRILDEIEKLFV